MLRILYIVSVLFVPSQLLAQESPDRFMLEAGLVGGSGDACPGRYIRVTGQVVGPLSLYGMVENYRCQNLTGTANRIGVSVLAARSTWLVRPELRTGIEYDGGDVSQNIGIGVVLGRRYGARTTVHLGNVFDDILVLFQMGGYLRF
ncbi:MAG: hypothetical protein F4146_08000 [Rhodothermaceae bacterium]|nr:hypothetical protein [Rhodothermaceae bacterium]MYH08447.1 hypothetical protein [Rhodothermaceae bacterium]